MSNLGKSNFTVFFLFLSMANHVCKLNFKPTESAPLHAWKGVTEKLNSKVVKKAPLFVK